MHAYAGRQFVPFLWWSLVWPGREANSRPTVREADTLPTKMKRGYMPHYEINKIVVNMLIQISLYWHYIYTYPCITKHSINNHLNSTVHINYHWIDVKKIHYNIQHGWLVVFYVPSTGRSFREGTPIYCPMGRMWSSIFTQFSPGIKHLALLWQSITLQYGTFMKSVYVPSYP